MKIYRIIYLKKSIVKNTVVLQHVRCYKSIVETTGDFVTSRIYRKFTAVTLHSVENTEQTHFKGVYSCIPT